MTPIRAAKLVDMSTWRAELARDPGSPHTPCEDMAMVGPNLLVIVDGATARTDTGCIHGVAWYADTLASAIVEHGAVGPEKALFAAIGQVAALHGDTCDLNHPATPSAAVGIVMVDGDRFRYLVLGDVTVVMDIGGRTTVVTDDRVGATARGERRAADRLPADSTEKAAALVRMKHAELAARNTPCGYWIAASHPDAVRHALSGEVPLVSVRRAAMLTDGAARAVDLFELYDWSGVLDLLATEGTGTLIAQVRAAEESDPLARRWPRNKLSDDATVIYCAGTTACGTTRGRPFLSSMREGAM
jgi:hypothetical protein